MNQKETEMIYWRRQYERHSSVEDGKTQPLAQFPPAPLLYPTLGQLRRYCRMSELEVARRTGIHYCLVRWMEQDLIVVKREMAMRVLEVLSQCAGYVYRVQDICGLRVRDIGTDATGKPANNREKGTLQ